MSSTGGVWSKGVSGPGGDHPRTATAAGGTHHTGMHSCELILELLTGATFLSSNNNGRWKSSNEAHVMMMAFTHSVVFVHNVRAYWNIRRS